VSAYRTILFQVTQVVYQKCLGNFTGRPDGAGNFTRISWKKKTATRWCTGLRLANHLSKGPVNKTNIMGRKKLRHDRGFLVGLLAESDPFVLKCRNIVAVTICA
jgi:hypothetical protein